MISKKSSVKTFIALYAAAILMIFFAACDKAPSASVKTVDPGSTWEVTEITRLSELTIAGGATVAAPEGYSLTMTVDHVETAIEPGSYKGDIVLTPTENIISEALMHGGTYNLRTAIYVDDGAVVPEKSVLSAVAEGTVTDDSATDVSISSVGDNFNGIIAAGDSVYTIDNPEIDFTGNGGNDFAGYGAAIMLTGNADVTVNNGSVITNGVIRTAVWAGGESVIHVNDTLIETGNPPLPAGYMDPFEEGGEVMMKVPFMLGMTGSCRATNLVQGATAYYTNSHIKAQGWGALSTDASQDVKLYATNCTIETVESGYGAYALGGSVDTFKGCTFNVVDMAVCGTGGDSVFTDGTVVNSERFGIMYHGSGDITIDKGSVFNTESTAIQLKSSGHDILVDNAQLNPGNGIIIQTMANDDPNAPAGGMPGGAPGGGIPEGDMPGGGTGTNVTFRDMTVNGDIIHGDTASCPVNLSLDNTTITGAITTAMVNHALGPNGEEITMETPELYYLIGEVTNTFCAMPDDPYGLTVSLDGDSKWVVDETSYITGLSIAEGTTIGAPQGKKVAMQIDGVEIPIKPGTYNGQIVIIVSLDV